MHLNLTHVTVRRKSVSAKTTKRCLHSYQLEIQHRVEIYSDKSVSQLGWSGWLRSILLYAVPIILERRSSNLDASLHDNNERGGSIRGFARFAFPYLSLHHTWQQCLAVAASLAVHACQSNYRFDCFHFLLPLLVHESIRATPKIKSLVNMCLLALLFTSTAYPTRWKQREPYFFVNLGEF